ncbi:MAG: hypothetical protein U0168_05435 [Nannocystaceae bacterium]
MTTGREPLLELAPRQTQARVDGVELDVERLGERRRRLTAELDAHEHLALLVRQAREEASELRPGALGREPLVGLRRRGGRLDRQRSESQSPACATAAVAERGVARHADEPTIERHTAVVAGQAVVQRDEHVVDHVLDRVVGDAGAAHDPPQPIEVLLVQRRHRGHGGDPGGGQARGGRGQHVGLAESTAPRRRRSVTAARV